MRGAHDCIFNWSLKKEAKARQASASAKFSVCWFGSQLRDYHTMSKLGPPSKVSSESALNNFTDSSRTTGDKLITQTQ